MSLSALFQVIEKKIKVFLNKWIDQKKDWHFAACEILKVGDIKYCHMKVIFKAPVSLNSPAPSLKWYRLLFTCKHILLIIFPPKSWLSFILCLKLDYTHVVLTTSMVSCMILQLYPCSLSAIIKLLSALQYRLTIQIACSVEQQAAVINFFHTAN